MRLSNIFLNLYIHNESFTYIFKLTYIYIYNAFFKYIFKFTYT
jgi:hypothetical protein